MPLIYRVHDEPSLEKIEALRQFLETLHISLPKGGAMRADQFNRILAQVKGQDVEKLVNEVVLRSQAQAEYSAENYGHFGLNLRRYAHFTSPIRRYADLIVHRALIRARKLGNDGLPESQDAAALDEIAAQISATERRAMKAERETDDRLIAHHLADRIGATFDGRICGVTRAGLFVKLDDTGADGFIPARTTRREYFRYERACTPWSATAPARRIGSATGHGAARRSRAGRRRAAIRAPVGRPIMTGRARAVQSPERRAARAPPRKAVPGQKPIAESADERPRGSLRAGRAARPSQRRRRTPRR